MLLLWGSGFATSGTKSDKTLQHSKKPRRKGGVGTPPNSSALQDWRQALEEAPEGGPPSVPLYLQLDEELLDQEQEQKQDQGQQQQALPDLVMDNPANPVPISTNNRRSGSKSRSPSIDLDSPIRGAPRSAPRAQGREARMAQLREMGNESKKAKEKEKQKEREREAKAEANAQGKGKQKSVQKQPNNKEEGKEEGKHKKTEYERPKVEKADPAWQFSMTKPSFCEQKDPKRCRVVEFPKKWENMPVACVPCALAKVKCYGNRPCYRCIRRGIEKDCVSRKHNPPGRKPKDMTPEKLLERQNKPTNKPTSENPPGYYYNSDQEQEEEGEAPVAAPPGAVRPRRRRRPLLESDNVQPIQEGTVVPDLQVFSNTYAPNRGWLQLMYILLLSIVLLKPRNGKKTAWGALRQWFFDNPAAPDILQSVLLDQLPLPAQKMIKYLNEELQKLRPDIVETTLDGWRNWMSGTEVLKEITDMEAKLRHLEPNFQYAPSTDLSQANAPLRPLHSWIVPQARVSGELMDRYLGKFVKNSLLDKRCFDLMFVLSFPQASLHPLEIWREHLLPELNALDFRLRQQLNWPYAGEDVSMWHRLLVYWFVDPTLNPKETQLAQNVWYELLRRSGRSNVVVPQDMGPFAEMQEQPQPQQQPIVESMQNDNNLQLDDNFYDNNNNGVLNINSPQPLQAPFEPQALPQEQDGDALPPDAFPDILS